MEPRKSVKEIKRHNYRFSVAHRLYKKDYPNHRHSQIEDHDHEHTHTHDISAQFKNGRATSKRERVRDTIKKTVYPPLKIDQVQTATKRINFQNHPIQYTPLSLAFPFIYGKPLQYYEKFLNYFRTKKQLDKANLNIEKKVSELKLLQSQRLQKMQSFEKARIQQEDENGLAKDTVDPFIILGFGLITYRHTLRTLTFVFGLLSLIVLPIIVMYSNGTGLNDMEKLQTKFGAMTLANIGYDSMNCGFVPFSMSKLYISCPYGLIAQTSEVGVGINSYKIKKRDACKVDQQRFQNEQCSDYINYDQFNSYFLKYCKGKSSCQIDLRNDDLYKNMKHSISYWLNPLTQKNDTSGIEHTCFDGKSSVFIQHGCQQSEEQAQQKWYLLSYVGCTMVFVACVLMLAAHSILKHTDLDVKEFDLMTITAGDYTVSLDISDNMYSKYLKDELPKIKLCGGKPTAIAFKEFLQCRVETILEKYVVDKDKKTPEGKYCDVSIADIALAFHNSELINMLKERGKCISLSQFDKQKLIDDKINTYILNPTNQKKLEQVCHAFITFRTEDGHDFAIDCAEEGGFLEENGLLFLQSTNEAKMILGEKANFHQSQEPNNIIWENLCMTNSQFASRLGSSLMIICCVLAASFYVIMKLNRMAIDLETEYPILNCQEIYDTYSKSEIQQQAGFEYYQSATQNIHPDLSPPPKIGIIACFCHYQNFDKIANLVQEGEGKAQQKNYTFTDENGIKRDLPICSNFQKEKYETLWFGTICNKGIIIVNTIIRLVVIAIMEQVGYKTNSSQAFYVTFIVFISQFFNTGMLLLLSDANLTAQGFPILSQFFDKGTYTDFNSQWYRITGDVIVSSMIFNSIFPAMLEGMFAVIRQLYRWNDKYKANKAHNESKTALVSIQSYIDMYGGPEFIVHFRYANVLNIIFVTMMYGTAMPILFPVSALSFLIIYVQEVYMLYYVYKAPPTYDEDLDKKVVKMILHAPLFLLAFGFWQLTSLRLMPYVDFPMKMHSFLGEDYTEYHVWYNYSSMDKIRKYAGPAQPMFWFWFIFLVFVYFRKYMSDFINSFDPRGKDSLQKKALTRGFLNNFIQQRIDIREDIPPYFECLKQADIQWSLAEEEYYCLGFHCNSISKETCKDYQGAEENMKKRHNHKETQLQGVHTYDMMRNPHYSEAFQYVAVHVPVSKDGTQLNREDFIIDDDENDDNNLAQSDLVKLVLNLPYMKTDAKKHFEFSLDWYMKQDVVEQSDGDSFEGLDKYEDKSSSDEMDYSQDKRSQNLQSIIQIV